MADIRLAGRTAVMGLGAGVGAMLLAAAALWVVFGGGDTVDRPSYAAGWDAVTSRQAARPGAASAYLRTDASVLSICLASADDGRAEQAGATSRDAFRLGCHDAVTMTGLEPSQAELRAESGVLAGALAGAVPETVCLEVPR